MTPALPVSNCEFFIPREKGTKRQPNENLEFSLKEA